MRFFLNTTIGWKPMCISQVTNRLFALVILLVMGHFSAWATEADLRELMQEDDYIKASLIVVSPGDAIYSAGGHLAIRMSCPVQSVDYVYEFDAALNDDESLVLLYLNRKLRGEYIRLFASDFLNNVHKENRLTEEYPLNLTPEQEVALWANLDDAVDGGSDFPFSPSEHNCCSMLLCVIESALQESVFSSPDVAERLEDSGRKSIGDFFSRAPFTGLLWNTLLGREFDTPKQAINLYYPKMIGKTLPFVKNPANGKPLIDSKSNATIFKDSGYGAYAPHIVFLMVFVIACFLTFMNVKGRMCRASQIFDWCLLGVNAAVGCILWYMFCASVFTGELYVNYLMAVFTPLPIALKFIRKPKAWLWYAKIMSVIFAMLLICVWFVPQLQYYGMWLFVLTMLMRGLYSIYKSKKK